jgi:hypothetical protein
MRQTKFFILLLILIFPFIGTAQVKISPFISSGYMSHLTRQGINTELGISFELLKRIDISASARYSLLDSNSDNQVKVKAFNSFISYVLINKEKHKLMLGPGISYGNYERYTAPNGFEKEYNDLWINPIKIRYDYRLSNKFKIGFDASQPSDCAKTYPSKTKIW